jgi:hypothetical protein
MLDEIFCGYICTMDPYTDKIKRAKLISMFTDLMVYDSEGKADGIFVNDFEDCLEEFMMENYGTEPDFSDVEYISKLLVKIRKEFLKLAKSNQ